MGSRKTKTSWCFLFSGTETFRFFGTKHVMIVMAIHKVWSPSQDGQMPSWNYLRRPCVTVKKNYFRSFLMANCWSSFPFLLVGWPEVERGPSSEDPLDEAVADLCFMKRCEKSGGSIACCRSGTGWQPLSAWREAYRLRCAQSKKTTLRTWFLNVYLCHAL